MVVGGGGGRSEYELRLSPRLYHSPLRLATRGLRTKTDWTLIIGGGCCWECELECELEWGCKCVEEVGFEVGGTEVGSGVVELEREE